MADICRKAGISQVTYFNWVEVGSQVHDQKDQRSVLKGSRAYVLRANRACKNHVAPIVTMRIPGNPANHRTCSFRCLKNSQEEEEFRRTR